MRPARVTFLGTGTSHGVPMIGCDCVVCRSTDPRDQRLRPSIYLEVEDGPALLVDAGPDLRQQALRHRLTRVDALLFTHSHADHVMGLDEVRRFNVLQGSPVRAFATADTGAEIRRTFAYAFAVNAPQGGGVPQLSLQDIDGPFDVGGVTVEPIPLLHGRRPILGFRFGRFAYLTDCNAIPEPSYGRLGGLDVLVLDALRHRPHPTHFTVGEATAAATRIGARQTYFTHMCHDLGHADTCAALPPGITLAHDALVVDVDVDVDGGSRE